MSVAHDLLKFGITLAVLIVVVAAMALFVSGYLSAYKPGEKGTKSVVTGVSGGKGGLPVTPSPAGVPYNMTAGRRAVPQFAQYQAPGAMPMMPVQPPTRMTAAVPSGPSPSAAPTVTPSRPSYERPVMPSAPGLDSIIQVLFRILPLIFSHRFDLAPIWPQLNL